MVDDESGSVYLGPAADRSKSSSFRLEPAFFVPEQAYVERWSASEDVEESSGRAETVCAEDVAIQFLDRYRS